MKFSPEDLAYDPSPEETRNWLLIGRGLDAMRRFKRWKQDFRRVDAELRSFFSSEEAVLHALRLARELMTMRLPGRQRAASVARKPQATKKPTVAELERWTQAFTFEHGFVKLDPALRQFFPDDASMNEALGKIVEAMQLEAKASKRRTA